MPIALKQSQYYIKFSRKIITTLLLTSFYIVSQAQTTYPFFDEIQAFKKADSINFPPPNQILFVGSSSFRKWTDVNEYFPGLKIINRGFGGSTIPDVNHYAADIIYPYHPKQIVIYCGDNDLASSPEVTPQIVTERFIQLYKTIRKKYPTVDILFVSIKPSPSRRNLMPEIVTANRMINAFLHKHSHTAYADVYNPMLNKDNQPLPYIFLNDSLHMNSKGYEIWKKVLIKYLKQ